MKRMENMKTKEQKNAVKKHGTTPNQAPQKGGAQKRIWVLNNRFPVTPAASVGKTKQTLATFPHSE